MQDRFKFRIWDLEQKKFFSLADFRKFDVEFNFDPTTNEVVCEYDKKRYVVIQSTGLKDKNGKLIFEGDIVKLFNDEFCNIHTVKFGDFAMYSLDFQTEYEKGSTAVYGWYLGGLTYPIPLSISLDTSGLELEVIGNIYENPELIGGAE